MRKVNYLNNKDILKEIHKSKSTFCSYVADEYGMFDYKYFNKYKYDDFDDDLYKSIFKNTKLSNRYY